MKYGLSAAAVAEPAREDANPARRCPAVPQLGGRKLYQALREIGEYFGCNFTTTAMRAQDARYRDVRRRGRVPLSCNRYDYSSLSLE